MTLREHSEFFFDDNNEEFSLLWILEHIAYDPQSEFKKLQKIAQKVIDWEVLPDTDFYKNKFGPKKARDRISQIDLDLLN